MKFILFILLLSSCSFLQNGPSENAEIYQNAMEESDYYDMYQNVDRVFRDTNKEKLIKLSNRSIKFLDKVYYRIVERNSKVLDISIKPKYFVIDDKVPYLFSTPKGNYYFSTGLLKKYLKNEEVFVAAFIFEIFKSHRGIYRKQFVVPKGYLTSAKMLKILSIDKEEKIKINEWCYGMLLRSGYDPFVYLVWLQMLHKNSLEFSMMNNNQKYISSEEFAYKKLITQRGRNFEYETDDSVNSSKSFYRFLNDVQKKAKDEIRTI